MRLWLYGLAALLMDWSLYVVWTVNPVHADAMGASPLELGVIQALSSTAYIVTCVLAGRFADRGRRPLWVRGSCVLMAILCLAIPSTTSVGALALLMPLLGFAAALFWPALQAAIGKEAPRGELEREIGLFNILWSLGKGAGFATGGLLLARLAPGPTLLVAAGGLAAIFLFYPLRDRPGTDGDRVDDHADPRVRRAFLQMSWVANFAGFGISTAIANQYIKWVRAGVRLDGLEVETFFGVFLGAIFLAQTATFAILRVAKGWTYRVAPLVLTQCAIVDGSALLALLSTPWAILSAAPLLGAGFGFAYAASLYYSLHTPRGQGRYSGLHEAVIGAGNLLVPLAGGGAAVLAGSLRAPYVVCAAAGLFAIAVQAAIYVRMRSSWAQSSTT